jgi:hypothetical protein
MNSYLRKLLTCCAGFLFGLLVLEISLRFFYKVPRSYYIWPPGLEMTFYPTPEIMPGIKGPSQFSINPDGIRGDPLGSNEDYRILAIGGSTTECLFLDQKETWPHLLQVQMQGVSSKTVWVGNLGKSGALLEDNHSHFQKLLPQYPRVDLALFLVGVNDLLQVLRYGSMENIPVLSQQDLLDRAFFSIPTSDMFYIRAFLKPIRRNQLYQLSGVIQDPKGLYYEAFRQRRKSAILISDLPELSAALNQYAKQVNRIIDLARERSIRILLLLSHSFGEAIYYHQREISCGSDKRELLLKDRKSITRFKRSRQV